MRTTRRTGAAPKKIEGSSEAKKSAKAKHVEAPKPHRVKDGNEAAKTKRKEYDAKIGGGVELRQHVAAEPLSKRVNQALDDLGVRVGLRVQPYDAGDWMDYAHSKKADRAVQVITLGETQTRYVLEERKEPDRLVLLDESEKHTHASALISDFGSFTDAVKSVLSEQLDEASAIREGLLNRTPRTERPEKPTGPRQLTGPERQLLEAEVKQLSRDVRSLKQELDGISKQYGYTRPWAMDEGREQFTLVNGRFDVLGYKDHLRRVEADQSKFDSLSQQHAQKTGQLELKLAQLKTGLATDVG